MKKALKIFGITLGSIIGMVLLVVGLALWVVFTPERLTPIIRNVTSEYVKCNHTIGKVELTFFSTFPRFGLSLDSIYVVNPTEGAPSDTVVAIPHADLSVNVTDYLMHNNLTLHTLSIPDLQANIYIATDGKANYDVFALTSDTTETQDTTSSALPFNAIQVDELNISAQQLRYISLPDSMDIALHQATISATVANWENMQLALHMADIDATIGGEQLAQDLRVNTTIPAAIDMASMRVTLRDAHLSANALELALNGWAELGDTLQTDMRLTLNDWAIDSVLALLPISLDKDITQLVKGGTCTLDATAKLNMADGAASEVLVHNIAAHVKHTDLQAKGTVKDPLGKLWANITADMNVLIADIKAFLPKDMHIAGRVKGNASVQMYLDDLMAMQLEKGKITGDMQLVGVNYRADGMAATLPNNRLQFQIPNAQPSRKEVDWLAATLHTDGGEVTMDQPLAATFGKTNISIEANNILGNDPWWHATIALQSTQQLHATMDSMDITIAQPNIKAYAAYHTQDTSIMPILDAQLAFERVHGYYTNIQVDIQPSTLTAKLQAPRLQASLQTEALAAHMGEEMHIKTGQVAMTAAARYNKNGGDNLLLKWNPRLSADMHTAEVALADWEQKIIIPEIDFTYSNRDCKIEQSKIIVGNSDFALTGELKNIGRWLRDKGVLEGELTFESEHTDINELLALLSADEDSEEESTSQSDATSAQPTQPTDSASLSEETEPFIVPTNVDLVLNTRIKEAHVFEQTARNLGGKVYVRNGVLVVEEMGFICNAAKLQLTAMYRTPRRNHIYVGFDYHMLDINIQELIGMIPQLDSMMPMLRSFKGEAEFHLAAETYTNAQYEVKPSTLRGAASLFGKDLVVLDNETFDKISKLLLFSKKTENKVDSLSAEITLYKKEIDVYPFCVSMDNYMVALGGRHNLDMSFNYDVNVLSPIYLGVNVSGTMDDLDIKLAPCKFAKDFKPVFHRKVDTQTAELRSMIRESMRKNVKIQ